MSNTVKSIGRHTLIYALGSIAQRAASFLLLPLYTRYLTPKDYGTLELVGLTTDVISMLAGLGVAATVYRYYAKYEQIEDKNAVVSTAFSIMLTMFVTCVTIGITFSSGLSQLIFSDNQHADYFIIALLALLFGVGIELPNVHLRIMQRSSLFVSISMIKLAIQICLNIYFVVFLQAGAIGVLKSTLIVNIVMALILTTYMLRQVGFNVSTQKAKEIVTFGAPMIFWSLGSFILTFSDRFFLKAYSDLANVGIYSLSYKFGFILTTFAVVPFQQIWEPRRFEIWKQADGVEIFIKVFRYFNILLISTSLFIALFSREFVVLMAAAPFHPAYKLVPIILLAYVLQAWTSFCNFGLLQREKTGSLAKVAFFSTCIALLVNFLLIPRWGAFGAAWATVAAFLFRFGLAYTISQKKLPINYTWGKTILLCGLATAAWGVKSLTDGYALTTSTLTGMLIFIIFGLTTLRLSLDGTERQHLGGHIKGMWASIRSNNIEPAEKTAP